MTTIELNAMQDREATDRRDGASQRTSAPSGSALWTGRILSGLAVAFLAFDAVGKLIEHPMFVQGTVELGYPNAVVQTIGAIELVCLVLYVVPRTALIGAVLWTGYLGGAIATHVRVGSPLLSHTLFPLYVAVFLWLGLWLRDVRLRTLLASRPRP